MKTAHIFNATTIAIVEMKHLEDLYLLTMILTMGSLLTRNAEVVFNTTGVVCDELATFNLDSVIWYKKESQRIGYSTIT